VDGAALLFRLWKYFGGRFWHSKAFVPSDEPHTFQPSSLESLKEGQPAGLSVHLQLAQNFCYFLLVIRADFFFDQSYSSAVSRRLIAETPSSEQGMSVQNTNHRRLPGC
jgi:hypothetical protein